MLAAGRRRAGRDPVQKALLLVTILTAVATFSYFTQSHRDTSGAGGGSRRLFSAAPQSEAELSAAGTNDQLTSDATEDFTEASAAAAAGEVSEEAGAEGNESLGCIKPEISHFPDPLISKRTRQHGAVILHILLAVYVFIGLTMVCDDYFVPALTRVSDALCLTPDVAGATLMAAGSSAPELATSVVAVFVSKGEVSVSSVLGSAVFNITLVIALCSLASPRPLPLHWYPVCRDSAAYLVCILTFLCVMANSVVSLPEALLFVCMYAVYCLGMKYNPQLEAWATATLPVPASWRTEAVADSEKDPEAAEDTGKRKQNGVAEAGREWSCKGEAEEEAVADPLARPVVLDDGRAAVAAWWLTLPLRYITVYTIPDCRTRRHQRYFLLSFAMSVFWICLYSYLLVWMVTIIGYTLSLPDTVMSLTFVAAAVSVQDALSGMAVVRAGHGDMAVSNAIGSNVFDFLICLGVPWLLQTLFINPGGDVIIVHKGVAYSAFILISTVVFLIGVSHFNNWKMDQRYGVILLVWYFVLITFASLYETNSLGQYNPEECESDY